MKVDFDYVIVGAGSAGCVLANRLSADPSVSVALVEAGGKDRHPLIHMPRGVAKLVKMPSLVWLYLTEPELRTGMKPDYWLRGKVLGGSSSVNGMVWVRGQPADFDDLAQATSDDWSWRHIGRAYTEIERHELGAAPTRGGSGPLRISLARKGDALADAVAAAGQRMGWPIKADINEPDDGEGVGPMPRTIHRGKRQSAAVAFLRPISRRNNLTIITHAIADKVVFEGNRAVGVDLLVKGEPRRIRAGRDVILCAGAVASPGILERSGIGDPDLLGSLGIPVVQANPSVGENMSEHRALRMQWRLRRPLSLNPQFSGWRVIRAVIQYYLTGKGPMSGAAMDMRAAFCSRRGLNRPDSQAQIGLYSWNIAAQDGSLERSHGFCAVVNPLHPASRGSVHIHTADPLAPPTIRTNYFANANDRAIMVAATRLMRDLAGQEPLSQLIETESAPGPEVQSDEAILEAVGKNGITGLHTVGSCRMGSDPASVVDPETRVRGVKGLRVVDASIMPVIPSGNTNAPTMALAWRAADIIQRTWVR